METGFKAWWRKWWFGFALAGILVGFEILCLVIFIKLTPEGYQWLGDLGFNASDYAVYLNYFFQSKNQILISNLYNNFVQVPRFDIFWSTAGLLVRAGLEPVVTHEILRWSMTFVLAFAIYATAKTLVSFEKHAKITSFFMIGGLGLGWLYATWCNLGGPEIPSNGPTPPDVVTEFAIAPVLIGGAHMILSFALELLLMRWIYELICLEKKRGLTALLLIIIFFTWMHPYYIPILGCQILICSAYALSQNKRSKIIKNFMLTSLALIPATGYYIWLAYLDSSFRNHHLIANQLRLGSGWIWLIALIPMFWAASRFLQNKIQRDYYWTQNPIWAWFWVASAIICLLLPFPWQRKYTQGLLMAGVILTLPYWLMIYESVLAKWRSGIKHFLYFIFFLFFISASYLYLIQIQWTAVQTEFLNHFYQPKPLFAAWDYLKKDSEKLIVTDDPWVNLWTPAKTGQHVWIGHAHETPEYYKRYEEFSTWLNVDEPEAFNDFLAKNQINAIIATNKDNQLKFGQLLDRAKWQKSFEQSQITVWSKE